MVRAPEDGGTEVDPVEPGHDKRCDDEGSMHGLDSNSGAACGSSGPSDPGDPSADFAFDGVEADPIEQRGHLPKLLSELGDVELKERSPIWLSSPKHVECDDNIIDIGFEPPSMGLASSSGATPFQLSRAAGQPPVRIRVELLQHSGRDLLGVTGAYELDEGRAPVNSMPVWRLDGEGRRERWLFSSCAGQRWCIHGRSAVEEGFGAKDASLYWLWHETPHGGRHPQELPGTWRRWGPSSPVDAGIAVRADVQGFKLGDNNLGAAASVAAAAVAKVTRAASDALAKGSGGALEPGLRVRAEGGAAGRWIGREGTIEFWDPTSSRWSVCLDAGQSVLMTPNEMAVIPNGAQLSLERPGPTVAAASAADAPPP